LTILIAAPSLHAAEKSVSERSKHRVPYNNPDLIVDLGVGIWAIPFPVDWDSDGDNDPLFFAWPGGPYYSDECRCGVDDLGGVTFERYGEDIADVIQGYSIASLPGWKNCYCEGIDNDEDGEIDEWEVTCARVRVTFDFKVFVGTEYVTPETVSKRNPFEPGFINELIGEYGCGQ
jgi:hypothetical protein